MSGSEATYDVVVLGAGSTGENVADVVVRRGLSACVVESALVGGECSYWACMPSKALLRPGQAIDDAKAVGGARQAVTGELDVAAVFARRDEFTHNWNDESQVSWLDGAKIALYRGRGALAGVRKVVVEADDGTTTLTARHAVVVATGSAPLVPPIPGLAEAKPWTAHDATSAKSAPRRLTILGGGVVGVEMATAYGFLGSEHVTLVEGGERVLAKYEPFVSDAVADSLTARGVEIRTGVKAIGVERPDAGGGVTLILDDGSRVASDELLVAVGRRAGTDEIGLDSVGLEPGRYIEVDDTMLATKVPGGWLYAAGDVNGRALLTHQGKYQARACGEAIAARASGKPLDDAAWGRSVATADHAAVPQVVFTTPEVAAVGLTEAQARDAGMSVRAVEYAIGNVAGAAVYADGYEGGAKMVLDTDRNVVVGVTLVGPAVGEMIHAATVMVVGEVPVDRLWHAVPSYPTISELWLRLLETLGR